MSMPRDPDNDRVVASSDVDDDVVVVDRSPESAPVVRETVVTEPPSREEVVAREEEEYGGMKFGSAFFGWLAATGLAVLLTALVAGAGAAVGLRADDTEDAQTIGIVGAIALIVVLFVAYLAGGYVAGRMARFNGARQGLAVWLWAVIVAVVVAVVGLIGGDRLNILANLDAFPRIPVDAGDVTAASIAVAVVLAVVSLIAAVLGGVAGMRFHRRVDRAGLGE